MPQRVNHEERKRFIAERAIRLFSKVGYDNVSLIMIAASSGVQRTVLYRYFCSKREILDAAILLVTESIRKPCEEIVKGIEPIPVKLEKICHTVVEVMFDNKDFLVAVFDFVVGMVRTGADMNENIHDFTRGTRTVLNLLIEHGIRRGELPSVLQVARTTDAIYAQFESCALRIVIGTEKSPETAKVRLTDVVRAISGWK